MIRTFIKVLPEFISLKTAGSLDSVKICKGKKYKDKRSKGVDGIPQKNPTPTIKQASDIPVKSRFSKSFLVRVFPIDKKIIAVKALRTILKMAPLDSNPYTFSK